VQSPTLISTSRHLKTPARRLLWLLLVAAVVSQAQTDPALPDWEHLSAQQREQLTAPTRDRWNSATPEQRTRMLARAERWQQMGPDERARVSGAIGRWQNLPPGRHHELRALYHHLGGLAEPEREAFLARWKAMTPEQRQSWAETNPAPPREGAHRRHRSRTPEA